MSLTFSSLAQMLAHGHDTVIDVRSPAEYAEDHVPGAINLPVLNNEERAEVGTIYVQDSPFKARKLGAALVFRNAANHIEQHLSHHDGAWRPLVYCWRGGQRSGSFTWMLQQIGWRADVVQGGYQTYRRMVHRAVYEDALTHRLVLLDGFTGTAKTEILTAVARQGGQVLDLEAMAGHRGSLLGERPGGQPSQKAFESRIACALAGMDPERPVLVEAEANKIGARSIPPTVWEAMKHAPRLDVEAAFEARCDYLLRAYEDILSNGPKLSEKLDQLRAHRSNALVDQWQAFIAEGDKAALTASLMRDHYDPAYRKARGRYPVQSLGSVVTESLNDTGIEAAATQVLARLEALSAG
ncbi:tRNA 2-selenouridine synthase [Tritonibacter multivorans]|uniref:tRNA 2-selenouridine synthase n=1 Tax=Tritonibacter multivorans TaxID=928856 RepID=A0A0P1GI62_9RHOB|nr:tRNA 2-selenouridine(34) synthase MnmH [Tritonibacter multivorans]MDA7420577.1 tRNA 2-selenouridine(34) synthase MnmH [Tritonibacter multivorans]CUH81341.1 tRNA 2-selenouridine synthase [Tritonibacter multivorans]SFC33319.1 tRNA 2-selenouridine synthase [Tritonibacter multivorans]